MTIGLILILCAWSFYEENPFYRFPEHTLVGAVLGNGVIMGALYLENSVFAPLSTRGVNGALLILPIPLRVAMLTRLSSKASPLSRIPMAVVLGTGICVGTRAAMSVTVIGQT